MQLNSKKIFIYLLPIIGILLLLGTSFAFFQYQKRGSGNNNLITGDIYLEYQDNENSITLSNVFPMTRDEAIDLNNNYVTFKVTGRNTYTAQNIYYGIYLTYGNEITGKFRFKDSSLRFELTEIIDGVENVLVSEMSFEDLSKARMYTGSIAPNTGSDVTHTYRLRMWIGEDVVISDTIDSATYSSSTYKNSYANINVTVSGDMIQSVYGVKRLIASDETTWTRINNSTGLTALAQEGTATVQNDFDNIYPWSDIKSYNYDTSTKTITAWYGDDDFKFNGTNGEVLTYIPEFYYQRKQIGGYEYINISKDNFEGSIKSEAFSIGRYLMSYDTSAHSISSVNVKTNINIQQARTYAMALGDGFSQLDYHYFILQLLYLVEYADYDAQSILGQGATSFNYSSTNNKSLLTETNVNRIVVAGNNFNVGQQVDLSPTLGERLTTSYRTVTAINTYNDETISGYEIVFDDGGTKIDTVAGTTIIYSCSQKTGKTDILGMKSGAISKDQRNTIIYRGVEDFYGNAFQFLDGINIKTITVNGVSERKSYVNYNYLTYDSTTFDGDYHPIGYVNDDVSGYTKAFGYDSANSLIDITTVTMDAYPTHVLDYYDNSAISRAILMIGGSFISGSSAGPWYYNSAWNDVSNGIDVGARIILQK